MAESTKALNSSVSTLKKNPGRIGRLVKAAKLRIVPPHQLTSGKAKSVMQAAIDKLKAKRGLNGVVGEGAGPFSDKAMQKSAGDRKDEAKVVTASTALGAISGNILGKSQLKSDAKDASWFAARKATMKYHARGHTADKSHVANVADRAERRALMPSKMRRAGRIGSAVGALTGAGLAGLAIHLSKKEQFMNKEAGLPAVKGGQLAVLAKRKFSKGKIAAGIAGAAAAGAAGYAAHKKMTKEAGLPAVAGGQLATITKRKLSKGKIAAGVAGAAAAGAAGYAAHKKMTKEAGLPAVAGGKLAVLAKRKLSKGKIAAGVAGAAAAGYAAHKKLTKKAGLPAISGGQLATIAKRKFPKGKIAAGVAAAGAAGAAGYAATRKKDMTKEAGRDLSIRPKQEFLGKGAIPKGAKDVSPRAVLKGKVLKGGKIAAGVAAAGGLAYAAKKRLEKSAAEKIRHNGEDIRRGTIGSAARKMAIGVGALGALGGGKIAGLPGAVIGGASGAVQGGMAGGAYGLVRSALRAQDGEKSMTPAKFDRLKHRLKG